MSSDYTGLNLSQGSLVPGEELESPLAFVACHVRAFQVSLRRKRLLGFGRAVDLVFSMYASSSTGIFWNIIVNFEESLHWRIENKFGYIRFFKWPVRLPFFSL